MLSRLIASLLSAVGRLGSVIKGVQVPTSDPRLIDLDKAAVSQTYCDEITGVAREPRSGDHRIVHPPARTTRRSSPRLQRSLRRFRSNCSQGQAKGTSDLGGGSDDEGRSGVPPAQSRRQRQLHRCAGLAVPLSLAATAARPDRDGVRRTRGSLASDPRCLRGSGRRPLLRDPSRRGCLRRHYLEMFLRSAPAIIRVVRSTTIRPISSCSNWTIWPSSTFTPSASMPST